MLAKINRLKNWQAIVVIVVVGIAVYSIGLTNSFQGDDISQIVNSIPVHSLSHIGVLFKGGTFYDGRGLAPLSGTYYRPLMTTIFSLIYTLFGAHPVYYHLFQLLLCIGSAILLYLFFTYSFKSLLSLVLALVFLVHPIDSQVVYAIPSMQDALFFFFGILGLYLLVKFTNHVWAYKILPFVAICMFLSMLSKETAVCFIAVEVLFLFWWDRKRLLAFMGSMGVPVVVYGLLRINAIGIFTSPGNAPIDNLKLSSRLLTAPSIFQFYITKLIFPWKLATMYYWTYPTFSVTHVLIPLLIDLVVIGLAIYAGVLIYQRSSKANYYTYLFFSAWALVGLLTCLQIVPVDMTACETWFYFSMAGVLGMIGVVLVAFQKYIRYKWFVVMAIFLIGVFGIRTFVRGFNYKNEYSLSSADISASKQDYIAAAYVSTYYVDHQNYAQAAAYAEKSVAIYPNANGYNSLGQSDTVIGKYQQAKRAFEAGLKLQNGYLPFYENLAQLTLVTGSMSANQRSLLSSIHLFPQNPYLWLYLAIVEVKEGNTTDAKVAITNANSYGFAPQGIYEAIMNGHPFSFNWGNVKINVN